MRIPDVYHEEERPCVRQQLDGEIVHLEAPLHFCSRPRALRVVVPPRGMNAMRGLVQLSDLHFGRIEPRQVRPDVTVVPGDLTQDARDREFQEVPRCGDSRGLDGHRKWVAPDLEPGYEDAELVVVSANTARPWPVRGGRINERQIARVSERMSAAPKGAMRGCW